MECTASCDKDFLALNLETLLGTFSAGRRIRRAPPQPSLSRSLSLSLLVSPLQTSIIHDFPAFACLHCQVK